jgi:hypothetical protein
MPIENFNLEEKTSESEKKLEKEELLKKLPPELREIHRNKSVEEIEKVIQGREKLGWVKNPPDLSNLHVTEDLQVETEKTHQEEIRKKLEEGPEQL